jgi:hypothetical protein
MEKTKKERITADALKLLETHHDGLRFSELVKKIQEIYPNESYGNFTGSIWNLDARFPDKIYKPARGLFRLTKYKPEEQPPTEVSVPVATAAKEVEFYQPFADWLVNGVEECTKAIPLGGNRLKEKWGTPDVFGLFEPRKNDIVQVPMEVIVAEIKLDGTQLIIAFGQACAYKLFAHKSYLVIPENAQKEDIDRLDALCLISGIGLVLFNPDNRQSPDFKIRVRASKHEPDAFYINTYVKKIEELLWP